MRLRNTPPVKKIVEVEKPQQKTVKPPAKQSKVKSIKSFIKRGE